MAHQQQPYNSRNYVIGYPNVVSSPKNAATSTTPVRQAPTLYKPTIHNSQSHLIQGAQQTGYQSQKTILEKNTYTSNRQSYDQNAVIPAFLVRNQGER